MKHTPGPWLVHEDGEANFFTVMDSKGNWLLRIQHNGEQLLEKQRANLHLIAAMPELLEALIDVLHNSAAPYSGDPSMDADFSRRYQEQCAKAFAVIAKAKGIK